MLCVSIMRSLPLLPACLPSHRYQNPSRTKSLNWKSLWIFHHTITIYKMCCLLADTSSPHESCPWIAMDDTTTATTTKKAQRLVCVHLIIELLLYTYVYVDYLLWFFFIALFTIKYFVVHFIKSDLRVE